MIKPSDKVLVGWITLVAAFASTNLGQVSATELTSANSEQSVNDGSVAVEPNAVEVDDTAVATHAENIAPENDAPHPEFSAYPVENAAAPHPDVSAYPVENIAPENDAPHPDVSAYPVENAAAPHPDVSPPFVAVENAQPKQTQAPSPLAASSSESQDVSENQATKLEHLVSTVTKPLPTVASADAVETVDAVAEAEVVTPDDSSGFAAEVEVVATVSPSAAARFNPAPSTPSSINHLQEDSRQAKLEHLAATATRELPSTSSLRERAASLRARTAIATGELLTTTPHDLSERADRAAAPVPGISQGVGVSSEQGKASLTEQLGETRGEDLSLSEELAPSPTQSVTAPSEALPIARAMPPEHPVVATAVSGPTATVVAGGEDRAEASEATVADSQPLSNQEGVHQSVDIPVEAFPISRVMSPGQSRATVSGDSGSNSQVSPSNSSVNIAVRTTLETVPEGALPRSVIIGPEAASLDVSAADVSAANPEVTGSEPDVVDAAQLPLEPPLVNSDTPGQQEIDELIKELSQPVTGATNRPYQTSPAITISNPSGFGADNFTAFVGVGYQERTRFGNQDDGGAVVGIGLGDARDNVGVQLSYTAASFGGSRDFGAGGFNVKVHRRLEEDWSVALGWEGIITTDSPIDFKDSIYGSVSHLIRTRESITEPLSRVAVTAGVGNGRFRTEDDIFDDRDNINVFGSVAVRVVEPVSAIVEWTGQDLAAGVSIAPFRDLPLVLLPAIRDITGAGDGSRFVLGAGISFQL